MNSDPSRKHVVKRIRPEGVAIEYDSLNDSQKEAFRRLLYTMQEAVENITVSDEKDQRFRPNNVVFISGARGSGKTCLLHSFMRYTDSVKSYKDAELSNPLNGDSNRRQEALSTVQGSIVWLPTIDVDPLPKDFDLVSSVLVRIRDLIDKESPYQRHTSPRPSHSLGDADTLDIDGAYERLLCDAAQAWQGGLVGSKNTQEPEHFAIVAKTLAEANISFSSRFRSFLNAVAKQVFRQDTIFVLPIDDTDLKPAVGLEVLKLLRMLHAPRLFVVAMGDIELFELVSSLEMMRELGLREDIDSQALLPVQPETVRRHVSTITATALRKLIPPDQRIMLSEHNTTQGLQFKPPGTSETLAELLDSIPIIFHHHLRPKIRKEKQEAESHLKGYDVRVADEKRIRMRMTLRHFLAPSQNSLWENEHEHPAIPFVQQLVALRQDPANRWDDKVASEQTSLTDPNDERRIDYFAERALRTSARRITDLWFALRRLKDAAERTSRAVAKLESVSSFFVSQQGRSATKLKTDLLKTVRDSFESQIGDHSVKDSYGSDFKYGSKVLSEIKRHYEETWTLICSTFKRLCRQSLMEEVVLDVSAREAIDRAFDQHAEHIDWNQLPVTLRPTWSARRSLTLQDRTVPMMRRPCEFKEILQGRPDFNQTNDALELSTGATVRFHFAYPEEWTVQTGSALDVERDVENALVNRENQFGKFNYRPLSTDTAALLVLYHDLLKFSPVGERFHAPFADMSVYEGLPWANTEYEIGPKNKCTLYWPAPPCISVFGLDTFANLWRDMTSKTRSYEIRAPRFALAWIIFGCSMVNSSTVTAKTMDELADGYDDERFKKFYAKDVVRIASEVIYEPVSKWVPKLGESILRAQRSDLGDYSKKLKSLDSAEREIEGCPASTDSKTRKAYQKDAMEHAIWRVARRAFEQYLDQMGLLDDKVSEGKYLRYVHILDEQVKRFSDPEEPNPKVYTSDFIHQICPPSRGGESSARRRLEDYRPTLYREIYQSALQLRLCRRVRIHLVRCAEKAMQLLKDNPDSDGGKNYREWLLNVVSLAMPEFGFDGDFRRDLLFETSTDEEDGLIRFIRQHRRAIRGRRARRLAKLVWLGIPHTAIRFAYADPNLWGKLTRLSKRGFFRAFHFVHEQHADIQKGLLWFNDDQRMANIAMQNFFDEAIWPRIQAAKVGDQEGADADAKRLNGAAYLDFLKTLERMPDSRELTYFLKPDQQSRIILESQSDKDVLSVRQQVDQALLQVIDRAAEAVAVWNSSSIEYRTFEKRVQCIKRLWWLESDSLNDGSKCSPCLTNDENNEILNSLEPWQEGRGLTPSIEEIDNAGKTMYGSKNWEDVSLRRFSYDLDFAEESHYRRS